MSNTPSTSARQQVEAARFRSVVSEALLQGMQGNINYLLTAILPLGSVIHSMLTEAQFQDIAGTGWILADGRDVSSSDYAVLTGFTTVPDARGLFLRGKDHGRGKDESGDRTLGAFQDSANKQHNHTTPLYAPGTNPAYGAADGGTVVNVNKTTENSGGSESRPQNVCVNIFIRIN